MPIKSDYHLEKKELTEYKSIQQYIENRITNFILSKIGWAKFALNQFIDFKTDFLMYTVFADSVSPTQNEKFLYGI